MFLVGTVGLSLSLSLFVNADDSVVVLMPVCISSRDAWHGRDAAYSYVPRHLKSLILLLVNLTQANILGCTEKLSRSTAPWPMVGNKNI